MRYAPRVQRAVFLDRDNTLIANDGDLGDPAAVTLLPGVGEGLLRLDEAGFALVVVTNQGGVARGRFAEADVRAVHRRLGELVDEASGRRGVIDAFYFCPFHPEAPLPAYRREHPWRKPSPGMLLQAAADLAIDLGASWLIGDAPRDIEAGRRAGCRTVLIGGRSGPTGSPDPATAERMSPDFVSPDFGAAAQVVLRHAPSPTTSRTPAAPNVATPPARP